MVHIAFYLIFDRFAKNKENTFKTYVLKFISFGIIGGIFFTIYSLLLFKV